MKYRKKPAVIAPLPTTRAKNAYALLSEVRALILRVPTRYNQQRYIARVGGRGGADTETPQRKFPSCGTVGCVAGWVATLKRGRRFRYDSTDRIASRLLGLTSDQAWQLFNGGAVGGNAQTKEHAKAGADHIARFQDAHAAQLKAKKV